MILIRPRCDLRCIKLRHHVVSGGLLWPLFMSLMGRGGQPSVDCERIDTLSSELALLMLKSFVIDHSGKEQTEAPISPAHYLWLAVSIRQC